MKIEIQESKMKQELKEYEESQQLVKSLQESHQQLANREKEYENKLKSAQLAKQSLEKAQQEARGKAELLAKQLEIFRQHGFTPQERAFQQTLGDVKQLLKRNQVQPPKCFISYAWENISTPDGEASNKLMQQWLERLSKDLQKIGCKVFFDLDNMQGNLRETMKNNIGQSNCFIVICTPQWKQRLELGLTPSIKNCMDNNGVDELEAGLQTLTTNQPDKNFNPINNASFEFVHIWSKVRKQPTSNNLILLHFSGSSGDSILPVLKGDLIRKVTEHTDEEYYEMLVSLSNPVGLISNIFGLKIEGQERCLKEYEVLVKKFQAEMSFIKFAIERVEMQAKLQSSAFP